MKTPDAWRTLGSQIHEDFLEVYPHFSGGIVDIANDLSDRQKADVVLFLEHLLNSNAKNNVLLDAWSESGSGLYIVGRDFTHLYKELLYCIKKSLSGG